MASALWSRVALPSLRVVSGATAAALFGTGATTTLMAAYASYNVHAKRPRNYADDFVSRPAPCWRIQGGGSGRGWAAGWGEREGPPVMGWLMGWVWRRC